MKFIPRQPQPPRPPTRSTTTTRFLRLQPADDVAETPSRTEPRPLPAFPETAPRDHRTASQRVRLRLDPAVASQPLPNARQLVREPFAPTPAAPAEAPQAAGESLFEDGPPAYATLADEPAETGEIAYDPAAYQFSESERVPQATAEESLFDAPVEGLVEAPPGTVEEPILEDAAQPAVEPAMEILEIPASAGAVEQVWVPPGPGHASPSTWLPPVRPRPVPVEAANPPEVTEPASDIPAPVRPVAEFSRRLPRPELRRSVTPLAQMTRKEPGSLGRGFWLLLVLLAALVLAALYFFGIAPRLAAYQAQMHAPQQLVPARPVMFVVARQARPAIELPVTGTVEASRETALYARTTGYVKSWLVDLGDKVQAGQVLAELDTPEVDHQLTQARASADQAKAQVELAQNESDRWTAMVKAHAVSQQDADAKIAALNEAQANFNAAEANVGRLADLEMFKEIRAPYAGTITARNLEVGTLVGAGPGPTGSELFRVTQTDPVRVFVNVPEANAPNIRGGLEAKVEVAAYPGRVFAGTVVRDAGALDARTHTLRTEVHVSNPDGALLPGTPANVRLQLVDSTPSLLVPSSSLIMSPTGASIARLVSSDGREVVRFVPVHVGRMFGDEVELLGDAVRAGDRLVADPPDDLQDGMVVAARPYEEPTPLPFLPPHPSAPRA
jgi:membrane fusion protein (multidrug efflux system)